MRSAVWAMWMRQEPPEGAAMRDWLRRGRQAEANCRCVQPPIRPAGPGCKGGEGADGSYLRSIWYLLDDAKRDLLRVLGAGRHVRLRGPARQVVCLPEAAIAAPSCHQTTA